MTTDAFKKIVDIINNIKMIQKCKNIKMPDGNKVEHMFCKEKNKRIIIELYSYKHPAKNIIIYSSYLDKNISLSLLLIQLYPREKYTKDFMKFRLCEEFCSKMKDEFKERFDYIQSFYVNDCENNRQISDDDLNRIKEKIFKL